MNVAYVLPLQRAWARAVRMLFRPFRLEMWLVLGFAAFLSEYLSGGFGGGGGRYTWHDGDWEGAGHVLRRLEDFLAEPIWVTVAVAVVVTIVVLGLLFMWISSRGKFIFLDNVAHERRGIVEPWGRLARLGNSLFLWRLVFSLACLLVAGLIVVLFILNVGTLYSEGHFHLPQLGAILGLLAMLAPLGIVAAYIQLFLFDFVVPVMYRHDLTASAAWQRFMPLFRAHAGSFIVYGLFVLVLWIGVVIAIITVGMMTCCVGFILLALPYIGSVLLLPLGVTFRALGPEFLGQFGPDYAVLAASAVPAAPAPAPGGGPTT